MYPYRSASHALARAFSTPAGNFTRNSLFTATVKRGYGDLTPEERIALDGMVQQLAMHTCERRSINVFRLLWEDDIELAVEGALGQADSFIVRRTAATRGWCLMVLQRWAGRRLARGLRKNPKAWAREMDISMSTYFRMQAELRNQAAKALAAGVMAIEQELVERELIPPADIRVG